MSKMSKRERREARRARRAARSSSVPVDSMLETGPGVPSDPQTSPSGTASDPVQPMLEGFHDPDTEGPDSGSAMSRLTALQLAFVQSYFECGWNATEAVIAINRTKNRASASVMAHRLLRNVNVKEAIRELSSAVHSISGVTVESVVSHLVAPIFADRADAFMPGTNIPLAPSQMPRHVRNAIKSITYHDFKAGGGIKRIEFRDPEQSAMIVAKVLQLGGFSDASPMRQVGDGGASGGSGHSLDDIREIVSRSIGSRRLEMLSAQEGEPPQSNDHGHDNGGIAR